MKSISACKRCTECEGEPHHWTEEFTDDAGKPIEPRFGCKHCDYACAAVECVGCDEFFPVDIMDDERMCPECKEPQGAA